MSMTYCSCKRCGAEMLIDDFDKFCFGQLCEDCRKALSNTKLSEDDRSEKA